MGVCRYFFPNLSIYNNTNHRQKKIKAGSWILINEKTLPYCRDSIKERIACICCEGDHGFSRAWNSVIKEEMGCPNPALWALTQWEKTGTLGENCRFFTHFTLLDSPVRSLPIMTLALLRYIYWSADRCRHIECLIAGSLFPWDNPDIFSRWHGQCQFYRLLLPLIRGLTGCSVSH